jgi:hypothetical protein
MDERYLRALFEPGAVLPSGAGPITVSVVEAGQLHLPDGQVVAADPFAAADTPPLAVRLTPGRYPVRLCRLRYANSPHEAIAAARLEVAAGDPVTWQLALVTGRRPPRLRRDEIVGYPVDSGNGAFVSPAAAQLFGKRLSRFGMLDVTYVRTFSAAMEANAPRGGGWANLMLDPASGLNMVVFQSGYGDGVYASYWGYAASGAPVCLLTDFALAGDEDQA